MKGEENKNALILDSQGSKTESSSNHWRNWGPEKLNDLSKDT